MAVKVIALCAYYYNQHPLYYYITREYIIHVRYDTDTQTHMMYITSNIYIYMYS